MRWPALVLIPALLAAMWLLDDDAAVEVVDQPDPLVLGPTIASDDSLGAFWFCAGGTGIPGGLADHSIVAINTTAEERLATITVYGSRPDGGERPASVEVRTRVPAYGRSPLRLGERMATDYVSATVELDGGGVLVEHSVRGPQGFDQAPCASAASPTWTVPVGATDITAANASARELLVFFNPFPADAVLDVQFSTEEGERTPEPFKGFVVPGRSVVGVDLAVAKVTVSSEVAAEVVARTGRVVVDRVQIFNDPENAKGGVALSSGVASPAEAWTFPVGQLSATRREQLVVYNPGDVPADVDVEVRTSTADVTGNEPFELTIQPHRHALLDFATEARMQTILEQPVPVPYSIIVRSADGTRISAERVMWSTLGQPGAGVATSTGSALAGLRLVADMAGAEPGSFLVLVNPSTETIARVQLSIIDTVGEVSQRHDPIGSVSIDLEPGAREAIPVEQLGSGAFSVIVESNVPIIGERDVIVAGDRFVAAAVPAADGASLAQLSLFSDLGG